MILPKNQMWFYYEKNSKPVRKHKLDAEKNIRCDSIEIIYDITVNYMWYYKIEIQKP